MVAGVMLAVFAGIILGFYALPEKFTKEYAFENTWGMFFFTSMIIFPLLAGAIFYNDFLMVYMTFSTKDFVLMFISSFVWGVGMMMWGKAINHIGLSLGFSLFIGTIIMVGPLLPFFIDGLPERRILITILTGIVVVLVGVIFNGMAGIERSKSESAESGVKKGSMATGILIAMTGGLLCTGFSLANTVGRNAVEVADTGGAEVASTVGTFLLGLTMMSFIYLVGGLATVSYSIWRLSSKKNWSGFRTMYFTRNTGLTTLMALFNFGASITFALSAIKLGPAGNTVGYAIYSAISVATAAIGGLVTGEWNNATLKARVYLYLGIIFMILGVVVIAWANSMAM